MRLVFVSFTTRPSHGSEGGVGWQFLLSWCNLATRYQFRIDAVIDERDFDSVRDAIDVLNLHELLRIHPVSAHKWTPRSIYGESRTRSSYMAWRPQATKRVRQLLAEPGAKVFHQATFATGSLPPVLPGLSDTSIWGPIAVPATTVPRWGRSPRLSESVNLIVGRRVASRYAPRFNHVVAQNEHSRKFLERYVRSPVLEPNIAVESSQLTKQTANQIIFAGTLVDRKRPWIAIEAMAHESLYEHQLLMVGDGPLREKLEDLAKRLQVSGRVTFLGRLSRDESIRAISRSKVLMLPSSREGAPWVLGEAASVGVPVVVAERSGAGSVIDLEGDGFGEVVCEDPVETLSERFAEAAARLSTREVSLPPSSRWSATRFDDLLQSFLPEEITSKSHRRS